MNNCVSFPSFIHLAVIKKVRLHITDTYYIFGCFFQILVWAWVAKQQKSLLIKKKKQMKINNIAIK